MSEYKIPWKSV